MSQQLPLLLPDCDWAPPNLGELPSWRKAQRIGIDTETCDPELQELGPGTRRGSYIAGISFAIEDGPGHYLPIRHEGGDNLPPAQILGYLQEQAALFTGELVGANLAYDLDFLAEDGVHFSSETKIRDVISVADPLIDEAQKSYSLDNVAKRRLGDTAGKERALLEQCAIAHGHKPKEAVKFAWRYPGRYTAAYAIGDVRLPLQVYAAQRPLLDAEELWPIFELESELLPCLVAMRRRGVRVDEERLARSEQTFLSREQEALEEVRKLTGVALTPETDTRSDECARVLDHLGYEVQLSPKTRRPSVDKELLAELEHPAIAALSLARRYNKMRTTFCASIWRHLTNGRVHCVFNQMRRERDTGGLAGPAYGRISSEHPNLQQQPSRDEQVAREWRSIYLPDEGGLWGSMDYSQQEPRWAVHFAELRGFPKAAQAAQRYRDDPKTDNHQMMADLADIPRKQAKEIYLGLTYGMGGGKLCKKLGLPTRFMPHPAHPREEGVLLEVAGPEGEELLKKFDREVPFLKRLSRDCRDWANRRGYIRTVLGRRCRFPERAGGGYDWTNKALNRLIQGSSADQTKRAVIECERAGHALQIQVHDEICCTVQDREHAEQIAEIMRDCVPAQVPFLVDVEVGANWGEAA